MVGPRKHSRRILFTPSPEAMAVLDEMNRVTGKARAAVVSEMFDEILPVVKEMLDHYRAVADSPEKARELVAQWMSSAHAEITQASIDFDRALDGRTLQGRRARARAAAK